MSVWAGTDNSLLFLYYLPFQNVPFYWFILCTRSLFWSVYIVVIVVASTKLVQSQHSIMCVTWLSLTNHWASWMKNQMMWWNIWVIWDVYPCRLSAARNREEEEEHSTTVQCVSTNKNWLNWSRDILSSYQMFGEKFYFYSYLDVSFQTECFLFNCFHLNVFI